MQINELYNKSYLGGAVRFIAATKPAEYFCKEMNIMILHSEDLEKSEDPYYAYREIVITPVYDHAMEREYLYEFTKGMTKLTIVFVFHATRKLDLPEVKNALGLIYQDWQDVVNNMTDSNSMEEVQKEAWNKFLDLNKDN
ncbi:MAG: hypothetical protein HPY53_11220 [Brevinematales bacterium]|nr:hypothetical protein [Brevinematales bacterium]